MKKFIVILLILCQINFILGIELKNNFNSKTSSEVIFPSIKTFIKIIVLSVKTNIKNLVNIYYIILNLPIKEKSQQHFPIGKIFVVQICSSNGEDKIKFSLKNKNFIFLSEQIFCLKSIFFNFQIQFFSIVYKKILPQQWFYYFIAPRSSI